MKDMLIKEFEAINNNLSILPTTNKLNKQKYQEYVDEQIEVYTRKLEEIKEEIKRRYSEIKNKYPKTSSEDLKLLDVDILRENYGNIDSSEKMNLSYYFYKLSHFYQNDLNKVNEIIITIVDIFKKYGITLSDEDYNYTEYVRLYIEKLFANKNDTHAILDKIYWENPNIIAQIEMCFRHAYFKYKKIIDKHFAKVDNSGDIKRYLMEFNMSVKKYESFIHRDSELIFSKFINGEYLPADYSIKNIETLEDSILLNKEDTSNYDNLNKAILTLKEYQNYKKYEYIITDIKTLYEKKTEYKGIYDAKYKEIVKKESELFKYNKKIQKLIKSDKFDNKLEGLKLERNNLINEIYNLYKELDTLKIKDCIFKYVNNETDCVSILKLVVFNFNYLQSLLKEQITDLKIEDIDVQIKGICDYVFGAENNIISHLALTEELNLPLTIIDKYRMNNINIKEENLDLDQIDKFMDNLGILIRNYDMKNLEISLDEINFVINASKIIETQPEV